MVFFVILGGILPVITGITVSYFFSISQMTASNLIWLVTMITTVFILSIGLPLTRTIGHPIAQVSDLCKKIMAGDLSGHIEINRRDEIGALASSLNKISSFLHDAKIELEHSEKKYQALITEANDAILLLDPEEGRILEANQKCEELTGFSEEELLQMKVAELHPAAEIPRLKKFLSQIKGVGQVGLEDLVLVKKSGDLAWVDARSSYIKYDEAGVIQSILRDTTDRKKKYILTEKEISFIHEMSRTLPLFQDFDQVLEKILVMLGDTLRFNAFTLVISENEGTRALIFVSKNPQKQFVKHIKEIVGDVLGEISDVDNMRKVEFEIKEREVIVASDFAAVGSQILLPLSVAQGMAGLFSDYENAFKKEDISLFSTLVSGISSIYIAYKAYCQVQELSVTDALTGLFNRRKFFEELEREMERANRYGSKLSLIMLDIDHFKSVNDQYGHQAGDAVLRSLSKVLIANTRKTDVVARYGGEEFIILLTETGFQGAMDVAKRINEQVAREAVKTVAGPVCATVSLGLASHEPGDISDSLLLRADNALYQAKNNGRNRVEFLATA